MTDYLEAALFLRMTKRMPAQAIREAPTMVKIIVPLPPVAGITTGVSPILTPLRVASYCALVVIAPSAPMVTVYSVVLRL